MSPVSLTAFLILIFCAGSHASHAQLWLYIGATPEKEKAFEKYLDKEASDIVTKRTIAYGDTFSYKIRTYDIRSFDGRIGKVRLWEKPFDGHVFHIDCGNDHLLIRDFAGLARVHVLSTNLLEIVYSPRGGSDNGYDNVLILGIDKGKLCIVMEIQSVSEYSMPDEYGLREVHFKLTGQSVANYQLKIHVRNLLKSSSKSKKSYDHGSDYVLKFDTVKHVFYSSIGQFNERVGYWSWNNKTGKEKITFKRIMGNYPAIRLGDEEYFFKDGCWYTLHKNNGVKYYGGPNTERITGKVKQKTS